MTHPPVIHLATPRLETSRLILEPLEVAHAREMAPVLADGSLYTFTGGQAPPESALRRRYAAQVAGHSPDGRSTWLNWILRLSQAGHAVGYVQATVTGARGEASADLAWVLGKASQGNGYAVEAAGAMVDWLAGKGVHRLSAHIHPEHTASAAVARSLGLVPAAEPDDDGELVWSRKASVPSEPGAGRGHS